MGAAKRYPKGVGVGSCGRRREMNELVNGIDAFPRVSVHPMAMSKEGFSIKIRGVY